MFFMILNFLFGLLMIGFSFSIDRRDALRKNTNSLVNIILTLASMFILMGITVALCKWGPGQLAFVIGKFTFVIMAWFCTACCSYVLAFPNYKLPAVVTVFQWIFNALALFMMFFVYKTGVKSITIINDAFTISSAPLFSGKLKDFIHISFFGFYCALFCVFLPFFTSLMVLVRAENYSSKLEKQRAVLNASAFLAAWVIIFYVMGCSKYQPMFPSMFMVAFIPQMLIFALASGNDEIWDTRAVLQTIFTFLIRYFIPAVAAGVAFMLLSPLGKVSGFLYGLSYLLVILVITAIGTFAVTMFKKRDLLRESRYGEAFEKEITSIDYTGDPKLITQNLYGLFKKYVNTSSVKILVNSGTTLETVYSSDEEKISLPIDSKVFEAVLSGHHPVVFREWAIRDNAVSQVRLQLIEMLNQTSSDAFILLNEGRQIVGAIFLGKKISGNVYSEYDYKVFTRLYSNFFVVGYYMKNILNEDVVGTVNREIKMSGQIITSIQENMDVIKHPKIDTGYLMVPAHNIGGEFVDMIRLSDSRYIYIIGALSGKGIAASMNMVILKSIIRTFLAETGDFKKLVIKVNSFIRESLPKGTFFAGTFGLLDFSTNTMYYINCGSPALFMYTRAYNNVIEIQGEGHILGFAKDVTNLIWVKKVNLAEGDIIFACTDGLIDTKSLRGDVFGKSRVQNSLTDNMGYPASKMAQFAYNSLVEFTSKELEDDVTVLVLKYLGDK